MIKKFNEYFLLEKLGISDEVSKLTNFILNNLENKNIIILKNNLPNLSFKLRKIIIDHNITKGIYGSFDVEKSNKNGVLYFHFDKNNITKALIEHECLHAFHFMKMELETTKEYLNKLTNLNKSNKNDNETLKDFILLYYYSSDFEISARIHEFYRKIQNYANKDNFYEILQNSEEYYISNRLKNINLNKLFENVNDSLLNEFFSTFENYEHKKSSFDFIKDFFIKKKIINRNINIKNKIDNYEKYFNKQGNFMFKKLTKIYGLLK